MTAMLQPRDERDPFCTCPKCALLAAHLVELVTHRTRTLPGANGKPVEVPSLNDPPDGTKRARRTCTFCGHVWHTAAEQGDGAAPR